MTLWRIHIRPGAGDDEHSFSVCLKKNILGVGWQVACEEGEKLTWDEYWRRSETTHSGSSWRGNLTRIGIDMRQGDLVWTRDTRGLYYLARVTSKWKYLNTNENRKDDIVNVRSVRMFEVGLETHVPGKIVATFRARMTVQRIADSTIEQYSEFLYNKLSGTQVYNPKTEAYDIFSLLSAEDCEDIIYVYLQTKGYVVFPSRRKADTMSYEYVLRKRRDGHEAIVQVKTGDTPINLDAYRYSATKVYLFSPKERYEGKGAQNVTALKRRTIIRFMERNGHILPQSVNNWMEMLEGGLR